MYEKKIILYLFMVVCLFMVSGCCTCGGINAETKDIIAGNSHATGKLEATITALDGTVANSRERIANILEASRGITGGVERAEYLFNEYESEVERLLDEIDRIRNEAEIQGEDNNNGGDNPFTLYNGSRYSIDSETQVRDKNSVSAESSAINKVN